MRVEFELSRDEFRAFVESEWDARTRRVPSRFQWLLLGALGLLALALGGLLTLLGGTSWLDEPVVRILLWTIGVTLGLLALVVLGMHVLRRVLTSLPPREPAMLEWRAIELTDEGVVETTASELQLTPWTDVREVRETATQIHLCLPGWAAHVVPKRAFASAMDAALFADFARRKANGGDDFERSAAGWSKPA